ncbi:MULTISPECIES: arsenate reductase (glutaredoxin) [Nitrospirillum]|uniref:Arsenate reductase n=1 Tax=Nitrospirillum viridazoti CBAmc TaxID=1441467 RepID=A0A248K1Z3_9PROT|nr:arsenate reductase (glutaredoxin) [Nitrospirillum amazonense CBAmc]TWB33410.1 arsenate reductase [Nitrospirillum amazonense]
MTAITIYHNPDCGTSRNVLAMIRRAGAELEVIEYLKAPPSRAVLADLIRRMGMPMRQVLRRKGTPYAELGLDDPKWTDDDLLDFMMAHPILINRPIVVTPRGVKLCRPSDVVLDLLPGLPGADFDKEEGAPFLKDEPVLASDPGLVAALTAAGLPVADLAEGEARFFAYRTLGGTPAGYGGYVPLGTDILVRSVVVPETVQGKGIGRNLVALLLRRAWEEGHQRAWLLTTSAGGFFEKAGFKPVPRDQAPASVLATPQAQGLCPSTATLLSRTITV